MSDKGWAPYVRMLRLDHWIKNVFVLPGLMAALCLDRASLRDLSVSTVVFGLLAVCLVSSSNYVLNEILDAPYDRLHPARWKRPAAAHLIWPPIAWGMWLAVFAAGLAIGLAISRPFALTLAGLWVMGILYNVPPMRSKEIPYLDVLSEAVNNPIRMLAGWYLTGTAVVPSTSLLLSYWMAGCYFMAIKRYAELHEFPNQKAAAAYRKSFAYYDERQLLISIVFYASHAMLFFGAFTVRYRLELILAFPLIALVMATYLWMAFQPNSPVQHPELLHKEPAIVAAVGVCSAALAFLLFADVPLVYEIFTPSVAAPSP